MKENNIIEKIKIRANFLAEIRDFFKERNVLEVDTPLLRAFGVSDVNLVNIKADSGFLITSPEYEMKKLLANGSGDIYQLSHCFRGEEEGKKHKKEFMLLEWYRLGFDYLSLINEVKDLICYLLKQELELKITEYAQLFKNYLNIDIFKLSFNELENLAFKNFPEAKSWGLNFDAYLDLLFTHFIEPNLGKNCLEFVIHYPKSQAALAKIVKDKNNNEVAARFEAYINGLELCNGFDELANYEEQKQRFFLDNQNRKKLGLEEINLDMDFLNCLKKLPQCSGVALGVDRLLMIKNAVDNINLISL